MYRRCFSQVCRCAPNSRRSKQCYRVMTVDLNGLQTEGRNPRTTNIDQVSTLELCQTINDEDTAVAHAVREALPQIALAIDNLAKRVKAGGRVVYVGAGTSGRLGVLDASELPPTFRANPEQFVALIAGGDVALRHAQEGAEDDIHVAVADLKRLGLNGARDCLIGIAASGRTPYVLSCLEYAHSLGCFTVGIACSHPSQMSTSAFVDSMISAVTGPEVITGSTRLKAGTATKLVLNMLSTGTMVKVGKTFGNIMIDVKATNEKLRQRSRNIIRMTVGSQCTQTDAELDRLLQDCNGSVKLAVASLTIHGTVEEANKRLEEADGVLAQVLQPHRSVNERPCVEDGLNGVLRQAYVLCVDGGGSKCAAVISNGRGRSWRGNGGPCNPVNVGIEKAVSSITTAVEEAVRQCPDLEGRAIQSLNFKQIWVGLAGFDRPSISVPLSERLEELFSIKVGDALQITTDIEMLVTTAMKQLESDNVIALIAGTGSIAMSFRLKDGKLVRTGRTGGWGPLLGDEGSGFSIGQRALQHCLEAQDRARNGTKDSQLCPRQCSLCRALLSHFDVSIAGEQMPDLLSAVVSPTESNSDVRRKIASAAPLAVKLSESNSTAAEIIETAITHLVRLTMSLRNVQNDGSLVMTGGLMQDAGFHSRFQAALSEATKKEGRDTVFRNTVRVLDPAMAAVDHLVQRI